MIFILILREIFQVLLRNTALELFFTMLIPSVNWCIVQQDRIQLLRWTSWGKIVYTPQPQAMSELDILKETGWSGRLNITWEIRESCWYHMWDSYKASTQLGFNGIMLVPPTDEDVELFADVILNGNLTANLMDYGMEEVILEEAGGYFSGDRSAKEVAKIIQNRVQIMMGE